MTLRYTGKLKQKCGCDCDEQPCGGDWYVWRTSWIADKGECSGGVWPAPSWRDDGSTELSFASRDLCPQEDDVDEYGASAYTYGEPRQCVRIEASDASEPAASPVLRPDLFPEHARPVWHWWQKCFGNASVGDVGAPITDCATCYAAIDFAHGEFYIEAEYGAEVPDPGCADGYEVCNVYGYYTECEVEKDCVYIGVTCADDMPELPEC